MENLAVCGWVSQTNALRWLCHHADAALDEPSLGRRRSFLPDALCLAETHRAWPALQLYVTFSVAFFLPALMAPTNSALALGSVCCWACATIGTAAAATAAATTAAYARFIERAPPDSGGLRCATQAVARYGFGRRRRSQSSARRRSSRRRSAPAPASASARS